MLLRSFRAAAAPSTQCGASPSGRAGDGLNLALFSLPRSGTRGPRSSIAALNCSGSACSQEPRRACAPPRRRAPTTPARRPLVGLARARHERELPGTRAQRRRPQLSSSVSARSNVGRGGLLGRKALAHAATARGDEQHKHRAELCYVSNGVFFSVFGANDALLQRPE